MSLQVIDGLPPEPKDFCVVCGKPNCCTLQHGQHACSDECCEIIIRGENRKVRLGLSDQPIVEEHK